MIQPRQLVAHRGYPQCYPENSLPGIGAAMDAGALWLEWDVQLSADRVPVVFHDTTLQPGGKQTGDVRELNANRLSRVQIGQSPDQAPVCIPRLQQAVELLAGHAEVGVFVEAKTESIDTFGPAVVVDAILPLLTVLGDRAILISFDSQILKLARDRGHAAIGWVIGSPDIDAQHTARRLQPDFLFLNRRKLTAAITPLWAGKWRWVAYTANTLIQANKLIKRGFDLVETNDIGGMIEAIVRGQNDIDDGT